MKKAFILFIFSVLSLATYSGIKTWINHQIGEKFNPAHTLKAESTELSRVVSKRLIASKGVFTDVKLYYSKTNDQLRTIEFIGKTDKGVDVIAEWLNRELKISLQKGFLAPYMFVDYSNRITYKLEITTDTIERLKGVKSTIRRAHLTISGIGMN